jgi:putative Ca2+/H+ antiporter (TMEM165/GDT1 family)
MLIFPFTVAVLPIFDALRIIVLRISHRTSPLVGDRSHIYDVLLAKRWTSRTVALASWSATVLCGAFSVLVVRTGFSELWLLLPFGVVAAWILIVTAPQRQSIPCGKAKEYNLDCNAD